MTTQENKMKLWDACIYTWNSRHVTVPNTG